MSILLFVLALVALSALCLWRRARGPLQWGLAGLLVAAVAASWHFDGWRWSLAPLWAWALLLAGWLLCKQGRDAAGASRRRWPGWLGFAAGACVSLAALSLARLIVPLALPALTGEHAVAKMQWVLRSPTRSDIHNPDPFAPREFLVNVYYPTIAHSEARKARYMTPGMAREIVADLRPLDFFLASELQKAHSQAYIGLGLSPARSRYPVVVFSPGHSWFADLHAYYLEQLASHGYVVFAVTHPGQTQLVEFPDGRSVRRVDWSALDAVPSGDPARKRRSERSQQLVHRLNHGEDATPRWRELVRELEEAGGDFARYSPLSVRKEDMIELLDTIQALDAGTPRTMFAGRLDLDKVAVTGMSYGGPTAQEVCLEDVRCKAIVNMDGEEFGRVPLRSNTQPALWFYTLPDWDGEDSAPRRRIAYEQHGGPGYRVGLEDANHGSFADWPFFATEVRWYRNPVAWLAIGDHIDREVPPRVLDYMLDFLDHHLQGAPLRRLDGERLQPGAVVDRRRGDPPAQH